MQNTSVSCLSHKYDDGIKCIYYKMLLIYYWYTGVYRSVPVLNMMNQSTDQSVLSYCNNGDKKIQ